MPLSWKALFFASILASSNSIIPLTFAQNDMSDVSPLKQFKLIAPFVYDVKCKVGLVLEIKASDSSPACVKPQTAQKLLKQGWALLKEQMVWFGPIQSSAPWAKYQECEVCVNSSHGNNAAIRESLLMHTYFASQNIIIIDAKVSGSSYYFLVSEPEAYKMIKLGYKELIAPLPSDAHDIN
jgi:hypothetical protein